LCRKIVINVVLFILICKVINDLNFLQWEYWATAVCLCGVVINNGSD
jgi:hypothetical protein